MDRSKPLERRTALRADPAKSLSRTSSGALSRSGTLARTNGPARKPSPARARRRAAPGREEWFAFPRFGSCQICKRSCRREAHHVLLGQYVERLAPERYWDLANRLLVGETCGCHDGHHSPGVNDTRIPRSKLPAAAVAFVEELLGGGAERYLRARYRAA